MGKKKKFGINVGRRVDFTYKLDDMNYPCYRPIDEVLTRTPGTTNETTDSDGVWVKRENENNHYEQYETPVIEENRQTRKGGEFVLQVTVIDGPPKRARLPVPKPETNGSMDTLYDQINDSDLEKDEQETSRCTKNYPRYLNRRENNSDFETYSDDDFELPPFKTQMCPRSDEETNLKSVVEDDTLRKTPYNGSVDSNYASDPFYEPDTSLYMVKNEDECCMKESHNKNPTLNRDETDIKLVSDSHEVHPVEQNNHETQRKVLADCDWDSSNDSGLVPEQEEIYEGLSDSEEHYYSEEDNDSKPEDEEQFDCPPEIPRGTKPVIQEYEYLKFKHYANKNVRIFRPVPQPRQTRKDSGGEKAYQIEESKYKGPVPLPRKPPTEPPKNGSLDTSLHNDDSKKYTSQSTDGYVPLNSRSTEGGYYAIPESKSNETDDNYHSEESSLYVETAEAETSTEFNGHKSLPSKKDTEATHNENEEIKNSNESKNEETDAISVRNKIRYSEVVVNGEVCKVENNDANIKSLVSVIVDGLNELKKTTFEMQKYLNAQEEKNISIATRLHRLEIDRSHPNESTGSMYYSSRGIYSARQMEMEKRCETTDGVNFNSVDNLAQKRRDNINCSYIGHSEKPLLLTPEFFTRKLNTGFSLQKNMTEAQKDCYTSSPLLSEQKNADYKTNEKDSAIESYYSPVQDTFN